LEDHDDPVAGASLTFLGTGTSVGVPVIGCTCAVCRSDDPRNRRLRSSILMQAGDTAVLVDSGPDLRSQALREGIDAIDAVAYTHAHLDHVVGFDDLRAFCWHRDEPLPLFATESCMNVLKTMFAWAFSEDHGFKGYVRPDPRIIRGPFQVGPFTITPLPLEHASVETIGFLFEHDASASVAYLPDVKRIPAETMSRLRRAEVLVIDALRPTPHPTHFTVREALAVADQVGADATWLTHLGHENDHEALQAELPPGVRVAWDGLRVDL
jgi:phosphoribosyl 1,2-cyclic phosphate phosphodiesterase